MVHQSSNLLKSHDRYVWGKHLFSGSESDHWFLSKGFVNESNSNLYFRDVNNNLLAHNTASATGHVIHLLFFLNQCIVLFVVDISPLLAVTMSTMVLNWRKWVLDEHAVLLWFLKPSLIQLSGTKITSFKGEEIHFVISAWS